MHIMSDNIENLILEHLRAIRGDIHDVKQDTEWMRSRISAMESTMARLTRDQAHEFEERISMLHQYDRIVDRIDKIEKRLEIAG
jgi:uncharacterized protein (DUF885 family)